MSKICFANSENVKDKLNKLIGQALDNEIRDIQILSCAPSGKSILNDAINDDIYRCKAMEIPFTTC